MSPGETSTANGVVVVDPPPQPQTVTASSTGFVSRFASPFKSSSTAALNKVCMKYRWDTFFRLS